MKQTRRSRQRQKWNVKTPHSNLQFTNPDRSTAGPPHLQIIKRCPSTPTPSREEHGALDEENLNGNKPSSLSPEPYRSYAQPSGQSSDTMMDAQQAPGSGLLLEDGEAPRSHAEVSLEDFMKAPRHRVRGGRNRHGPTQLRIEPATAQALHAQVAESHLTPETARRIIPPPEFVPMARQHPVTPQPQRLFGPYQLEAQTEPRPLRSIGDLATPRTIRQGAHATSRPNPLIVEDAVQGSYREIPNGKGGVSIQQCYVAYGTTGRAQLRWKVIGEMQSEDMDSLQQFLALRGRYQTADGRFDRDTYDQHKDEAIKQMWADGQIQPPDPLSEWTPHSASSSLPSLQSEKTPAPPPGIDITPQRFDMSQMAPVLDINPVKGGYTPFSPQDTHNAGLHHPQYDPFVSPVRDRHQQARIAAKEFAEQNEADVKTRWGQENMRRAMEDQSQRERAEKAQAALREKVGLGQRAASHRPDLPRRTVLHDPLQKLKTSTIEQELEGGVSRLELHGTPAQRDGFSRSQNTNRKISLPVAQMPAEWPSLESAEPCRAPVGIGQFAQRYKVADFQPSYISDPHVYNSLMGQANDQESVQGPTPSALDPQSDAAGPFPFDINKSEEELRNPFAYQQTGHPPFFTTTSRDVDDNTQIKLETADEKFDRIWYSAYRQQKENMNDAAVVVKSTGKKGDRKAEDAATLMVPVFKNLTWYKEQANKRASPAEEQQASSGGYGWQETNSKTPATRDYFAKQYDPLVGAAKSKVAGWLAEFK